MSLVLKPHLCIHIVYACIYTHTCTKDIHTHVGMHMHMHIHMPMHMHCIHTQALGFQQGFRRCYRVFIRVYLSIYLSICLSIAYLYIPIYLHIYLSNYLSMYLSVYQPQPPSPKPLSPKTETLSWTTSAKHTRSKAKAGGREIAKKWGGAEQPLTQQDTCYSYHFLRHLNLRPTLPTGSKG